MINEIKWNDLVKKILVIENDRNWKTIIERMWRDKLSVSSITVDLCLIESQNDINDKIKDDDVLKVQISEGNLKEVHDYDLIFLDLYLWERHPQESPSGEKILEKFRVSQRKLRYVPPVIILSGSQNLDRALRLQRDCGAFDYICKVEIPEFKNIIEEKKKLKERLEEDLGLARFIKDRKLKAAVMAVKRITELDKDRFWYGYKVSALVDHSYKHALGVWKILYRWLKDSPLIENGKLGDKELYLLLMSALLHDIGSCGNEEYVEPVEVRQLHGIITEKILSSEEPEEYGFIDFCGVNKRIWAKKVGLICKYHEGKVPITKQQKIELSPERVWKMKWDWELFSRFYSNQSLEEAWNTVYPQDVKKALLLAALLMFADAAHIERSRVDGNEVRKAREKVIDKDGIFYTNKLLARKQALFSQIFASPFIGKGNCEMAEKEFKSLFKNREYKFDTWKITNENEAERWYGALQNIIPIYDYEFLSLIKHISFLKKQKPHYKKHFSVPSETDEKEKTIDFVWNRVPPDKSDNQRNKAVIVFNNKAPKHRFYVTYTLETNEESNAKKIAGHIKEDLLFEWERIGDIIARECDHDKNAHWEIIDVYVLTPNGKIGIGLEDC